MGPNDATRRLGLGMFYFFFLLTYIIFYYRSIYGGARVSTTIQQHATMEGGYHGPKRRAALFGPRYVFFFLFTNVYYILL
jgi:hypothetical protein